MINETDTEYVKYFKYPKLTTCFSLEDMVKHYHETADLGVGQPPTKQLKKLRTNLLQEEFEEIMAAEKPEEVLKELCDFVFVAVGTCVQFGWDFQKAFERVYKNNMDRMYQDDGTIKRREDGKIIKNPNTPKVQLDDLV